MPRPARLGVGRGLVPMGPRRGTPRTTCSALGPAWRGRPDPMNLANLRALSDGEEDFALSLWHRHGPEVRVLLLGLVRAVGAGDAARARACLLTLRGGMDFFGALRLERLGALLGAQLARRGTRGCLPLLVAYLAEAERILPALDGLGA